MQAIVLVKFISPNQLSKQHILENRAGKEGRHVVEELRRVKPAS
jgi:hypothetical protein